MRRVLLGAVVLPFLAGCADVPVAGEDHVVTLLTPSVFRGGEVTVVVPWATRAVPRFAFDDSLRVDTADWRRVAPDTFVVAARWTSWPHYLADGPHTLTVEAAGVRGDPVAFASYGDVTWTDGADVLGGVRPVGGQTPSVWVGLPAGLARIDLRLPRSTAAVDSGVRWECLVEAGPSSVEGAIVVAARDAGGGCGPLLAVTYGATRTVVDSGPPSVGVFYAAHLGQGRWFLQTADSVLLRIRGSAGVWSGPSWSALDYWPPPAVSADGTRAAILDFGGTGRLFDLAAGTVVTTFSDVEGVVFLGQGDTLLLTAGSQLMLADAGDGHILRSADLRYPIDANNVVEDPGRPWIYLADMIAARVIVVDRRTWTSVGILFDGCMCMVRMGFALSSAERTLYYLHTVDSSQPFGSRPAVPYGSTAFVARLVP